MNSIICSIYELCFDMSHIDFLVTIWRRDSSVLGLVMALGDNILRIHKISGISIVDYNNNCRQSRLAEVLEQQLLVNDQFLCVNGQTDVLQMLLTLSDVDVERYHVKVRRYLAQGESLQKTITMNGIPGNHQDMAVDLTAQVSLAAMYPFRSVISDYWASTENQRGYLDVRKGDIVIVKSRIAASVPENSSQGGYVYVTRQTRGIEQGWIPIEILGSSSVDLIS